MKIMNNDRVVLVTGASSGIGKCCAEYLAKQGYRVYGTSRRDGSTDKGQRSANANLFQMIRMDVTDELSVKHGIDHIIALESRIDVVMNNAGFAIIGSLEDTTIEEVKSQLETNFFGSLRVCRAVLPVMRRQSSGHIINISSIGGLISLPFQSAYSASKFALEGAMEALRMEVRPFGIQVVLIEPGDFNTEITQHRRKTGRSAQNSAYTDTLQNVLRIVESGERNAPTPERIARLINKIIHMNSPRLRYTVGKTSQRLAVQLKKILPSRLFESLIASSFQAN
jgi:NAD(P)-dependent dehydrogenase (short-subunit alcohol dehydrogenase family)